MNRPGGRGGGGRVAAGNEEAIEAWNGVLFDRFVRNRDILTTGLGAYGEHGLRLHPPRRGDRALDVGCGFGDTTRHLAELVGPQGEADGVDAAERFIDAARRQAADAGVTNTRFLVADVEACELDDGGPGPFSMANADTTTDVLLRAGFEDISLHRCDVEIAIGADLGEAVEFVMALGPAGELIRLAGIRAGRRQSEIVAALHEALAEFQGPDRPAVRAPASAWVVGARRETEAPDHRGRA